jgi:Tfp pilus assembly protein PilE
MADFAAFKLPSKPSYLGAFLRHHVNRMALLASGVVGIFASIPFGWTGLALVGVLALGTEILAALAVPELPSFKAWVDREHHQQTRAQRRLQLLNEVSNFGDTNALSTYQHMFGRVQSLYATAGDNRNSLTRQDVEKLEDLTVHYLSLCVVNLSLKQRKDHSSEEVAAKRIASLQAQLKQTGLPPEQERQLRNALGEYMEVMQRSRRLAVRRSALEATLLAMPDKMEEVYQLVITSPYSTDMGGKLEESLSRLRIAEEVAAEFDSNTAFELTTTPSPPPVESATAPSTAQKAARRVAQPTSR